MGTWRHAQGSVDVSRPILMAILNLTPDSFSDGGDLPDLSSSLAWAAVLAAEGADILDVGGESTRPGAAPVSADAELDRVLPFIEAATERFSLPISIDTRRAAVARAAVEAGACIVNDVTGLRGDPNMPRECARSGVGVVVTHTRGTPRTMARLAQYDDVVEDVTSELNHSVAIARAAGVRDDALVVDPGLGFAKTAAQSYELLRGLDRITELGFPVLVGPSRKSFLDAVLHAAPKDRVEGTVVACVSAYARGARIFRVHEVRPVKRALAVAEAVEHGLTARDPPGVAVPAGSGAPAREGTAEDLPLPTGAEAS